MYIRPIDRYHLSILRHNIIKVAELATLNILIRIIYIGTPEKPIKNGVLSEGMQPYLTSIATVSHFYISYLRSFGLKTKIHYVRKGILSQ